MTSIEDNSNSGSGGGCVGNGNNVSTKFPMKEIPLENGADYVPVADFYNGRSIFITGGTGFMGKVSQSTFFCFLLKFSILFN